MILWQLCVASTTIRKESDSDIEEDQRSSSELLANLNAEFHKRALLANQRRFCKRSGRGKNEKGLVAESFNKDEESVSFDNEGVTTFKALMAVADELSVRRVDVWVEAIPSTSIPSEPLVPQDRWSREKHIEVVNVIGKPLIGVTTRSRVRDSKAASSHECLYVNFLSQIEPKRPTEALEEEGWIITMQEELNQLKINKVWTLVPLLNGFQIKQDFQGISICQEKYVKDLLKKYDLADSASVKCPMLPPNNLGPDKSRVSVNEIMFRVMIRDHILKGDIELHLVPTDLQLADIFTKPLAEPSFTRLIAELALTIQLSAMYAKYLKEFWYTSKVENNIITFSLSHVEKPLSFNHDLFLSVIGLDYAKKFESLPSYEDVKEGLPTLGNQGSHNLLNVNQQMIAYVMCRDLKIDITCIIFNDLATKLSAGGKKGREKNVCYVRYMSIIMEHLLEKYYLNDDLKPMKSYQMTDATFKNSKIPEVPLTSHMRRIAQLLEKPLNPFSKEVNIEASSDMSLSRTSEHSVSKPKAETDKKRKTKKNPSSSKPKVSKDVVQTSHTQSSESQPADEIEVPVNINQSLEASNSGLQDMGDVPLESFHDADESPYNTESKIKIMKRFKPTINDKEPLFTYSEERYADKLIEELADMNASAKKPSLSDPLSHLCNEEKNNLESPKSAADVDNAQEEQKSDDISKVQVEQHSDNKSEDANENQKSAAKKVNTYSALIIHPLKEKPLEDEPPSKKPMFKIPKEILSPTPLNSIRPQFITLIIINMPQNQDSSILSKPADKGKAIAAEEYPIKELIPLLEESGSSLKNSKLKLFSSNGGQMTIKKAKAQIEELRKIKLLKAEKEKSDKELRTKEVTLRITRDNDPTTLTVYEKFGLKMLGLTDGIEVHALASKGVIGSLGLVITEPEAGFFYYNRNFDLVFQREHEFHLASTTQLIKQLKHIKRDTLEVQQMVKKLQFAIEARDDVDEARKIIRDNLDDGSI
nr:copia protein [Tanacetum cinerariifolium]